MREIIKNHVGNGDLQSLVKKISSDEISKDIQKACQLIFPLNSDACLIEKVKVLRKPKRDVAKLMQIHNLQATFDEIKESEQVADASGAAQATAQATTGAAEDVDVEEVE